MQSKGLYKNLTTELDNEKYILIYCLIWLGLENLIYLHQACKQELTLFQNRNWENTGTEVLNTWEGNVRSYVQKCF